MNVGLIDVDSHNFPNLALMKISAHHKNKGDNVEFYNPFNNYDIVYKSKIFTFTKDYKYFINAKEVFIGGTGYDLDNILDTKIEHIYPDYNLYEEERAIGFLTRGCPRNCPFCIVGKKEGLKSQQVADLKQFWSGQREIKLLDPNLLACPDKYKLLQQLIDSKAWVDFTQGLDIRLMTDDAIDKIRQIKIKMLHFAWDRETDSDLILKNLVTFRKAVDYDFRKLRVYVLSNFETNFEFDLYRVYKLREMGYDPYIMIYNKQSAPKRLRRLQRWVNNKFVFRSCEKFEDYWREQCLKKN